MSRSPVPEWVIDALLEQLPDLVAVYQFGTWDTPYQRPDSDLDLAVLPVAPLPAIQRWDLAQELAGNLGRDVDLIDLLTTSTVMRAQVIAYGQRLYCVDTTACQTFEIYAFSSYARLNEERRGILQEIQLRGSVYGR